MEIRKAAVMGSGIMGASIAANLAGVGVDVILLDLPGLAEKGLKRALELSPPPFYSKKDAEHITTGSFDDDMGLISDADWIIEAVVENLEIKRELLKRVSEFWKEGSIVSTNTSGLSINRIVEELPSSFRSFFLGTHYFNPPRYMKLLEIIPAEETKQEVIDFVADFAEKRLGKGVVFCKDTPNFIANRIGIFSFMHALKLMVDMGLSIEEVDRLTGPAIGRPRTAAFRTGDLVGVDVILHVARNSYENLPNDPNRDVFKPAGFLEEMVKRGWLGQKSGQGFYKKEGDEIFSLDYEVMDYRPRKRASFASLEMASGIEDLGERLKRLISSKDRAGEFLWKHLSEVLIYAGERIPEISDDIINIDKAMKWGFNWEIGPFEIWDSIGVRDSSARMEKEGKRIPEIVKRLLDKGYDSFYVKEDGRPLYFDCASADLKEMPIRPEIILLPSLKERERTILSNPGATLIDLDDGITCLEFHTKMNSIGQDIVLLIRRSLEEVERNFEGLVIGNQGGHFSAGANLMMVLFEAQEENWEDLNFMINQFQQACMAIKLSRRPVVAAPFGMTLGGGLEICLHSHKIRAAAESYMGFVEMGVGVIPAGGGTKEMVIRSQEGIPEGNDIDLFPMLRRAFENIARATVSSSAKEAKELAYLRRGDGISLNHDFLLNDAKTTVKNLSLEGFTPSAERKDIRVVGRDGYAAIRAGLYNLRKGEFITEYEEKLASKLAYVITGGDAVPGSLVSEQHLLDLEREAFLSLCGEAKTQERMQHMLKTGKPLRN